VDAASHARLDVNRASCRVRHRFDCTKPIDCARQIERITTGSRRSQSYAVWLWHESILRSAPEQITLLPPAPPNVAALTVGDEIATSVNVGSAPTTSAGMRRRPSNPTHTSLPSCSRPSRTNPPGGPGRKNGSAGGRTKEWHETGGQNDFKSDILIPSSHPSTKPGQVHAVAYRSIATHAPISRCAITTRHYGGHGNASARARATRPGAAKCRCSG
jgi:hypothetical protein